MQVENNAQGRPLTQNVTPRLDSAKVNRGGRIERGLTPGFNQSSALELDLLERSPSYQDVAKILKPYDGCARSGSKKDGKIDFKEYKTYESDLEMEKMADYDGNGRLSSAEEKLFTEMQKNSVSSTWFTLGNVNFNIQKNELANVKIRKDENGFICLKHKNKLYKIEPSKEKENAPCFKLDKDGVTPREGLKYTVEDI